MEQPAPHLFVIPGGTGDLAEKKLLPALYHLATQGRLGERYRILAIGRKSSIDDAAYRKWAREALQSSGFTEDDLLGWCDDCLAYQSVADTSEAEYARLAERIDALDKEHDLGGNRTFYLALPPRTFIPTIDALGRAGLAKSAGYTRLVIEKPFGRDIDSALALNAKVHEWFDESQVYRIDHYLGKETVQNLLVFRFGNSIFEDLWNRDRIESVQITVAEDVGVGDRAGFYEHTGALRDIVQNHVAQVMALAAMEPPIAFDAPSVRYEKLKVLRAIQPLKDEDVVFGRYAAGTVRDERVPGYLEEEGVAPDSKTETAVALRLEIDNWRWQGVPFFVRTGKRLAEKLTEIAVVFRRPPVSLFGSESDGAPERNVLFITLQPDEGFTLTMDVKAPGEPLSVKRIPLAFRYGEEFGELPDAYETLILDVLTGDQTLFVHADEAVASWRLFDPVLARERPIYDYPAGSWGPRESNDLVSEKGQSWQVRDR